MTALMRTAEDGFIQATKLLLNTGRCDLDIQDDEGRYNVSRTEVE
jgi:hypothetical protein